MLIANLLILPFFSAFLSILAIKKIHDNRLGWLLGLAPLVMFLSLLINVPYIAKGEIIQMSIVWFKQMDIYFSFRLDGLSQLMMLIISGIGFPLAIYSKPYFKNHPYLSRYYFLFFLFMFSMTGAVCANDLLTLFVFWEATSICSFLLIGLNHRKRKARKAAIEALFITALGGMALLAAFILLADVTGTQDISLLVKRYDQIHNHPFFPWILSLFLIGAFTKSALFPFSFWLPGAMEAPSPVSAYLHSATMVQLGIYLLARFHPLFASSNIWFISLTTIGGITMLSSVLAAFKNVDVKLILAYTTVAALGSLVFILAGNQALVIKAAVSFLLVHALYKANLFMAIGVIQKQAGTRHLNYISGLSHTMPITFLAVFVAGFSMAGLPPLLGFYVKELVYEASLSAPIASYVLTFIVVLTNMMMAAIAFILVINIFFGKKMERKIEEANLNMSMNALFLAIITLFLSLYSHTLDRYVLMPATNTILGKGLDFEHSLTQSEGMMPSLILSIITLSGAVILYKSQTMLRKIINKTDILHWIIPYNLLNYLLKFCLKLAASWTNFLQSGYLNRYIAITFLSLGILFSYNTELFEFYTINHTSFLIWIMFSYLILSASSLLFVRRFISGVLGLGTFGLGLAFFFIIQGAVDLAITQVLVETLMVILIVFTVANIKKWPDIKKESSWHRITRAVIALLLGLLTTIKFNQLLQRPFDNTLGNYFIENSLSKGHGHNVVNVILVYFRSLDTLGESLVLLVSALGIFSLLRYRLGNKK